MVDFYDISSDVPWSMVPQRGLQESPDVRVPPFPNHNGTYGPLPSEVGKQAEFKMGLYLNPLTAQRLKEHEELTAQASGTVRVAGNVEDERVEKQEPEAQRPELAAATGDAVRVAGGQQCQAVAPVTGEKVEQESKMQSITLDDWTVLEG